MASLIYNSCLFKALTGSIDFDTDAFYGTLHTSSYTADKKTHDFANDLTNEVTGTGYTAGGLAVTVTVTQDNTNDRIDITIGQAQWVSSTITARYLAVRKRRGGALSADELVGLVDFGVDKVSDGGPFTVEASTLRITNT